MPGTEEEASVSELLWYYSNYKRGQLPEAGGLLDQSAYMMTMFRIIDGAVGTIERHHQEKAEREARIAANRGQRGGGRLLPRGSGRP